METTSISQDGMMGTPIQTIRQKNPKNLAQASQNSSLSRFSSTGGRLFRFRSQGPYRQSANKTPNQNYKNQTNPNKKSQLIQCYSKQ